MKCNKFCLFLLLVFTVSLSHGQKRLVWEEQFEGSELDMDTWNFELGDGCPDLCGWGNNERQVYTDKNFEIKDGVFEIHNKYDIQNNPALESFQ